MRIRLELILALVVSIDYIALSSQSDRPSRRDSPPGVPGGRPPAELSLSLATPHPPPARSPSPAGTALRARSKSPPAGSPLRTRSASPPAVRTSFRLGGLTLEQLGSIRLIPHKNPNRRFEIRGYTFPRDAGIHLKERNNNLLPLPTGVRTVLSTSDDEVFAIFERGNTILRGMYATRRLIEKRVKINMQSGRVEDMTTREAEESPLGRYQPISRNFEKVVVDDSSSIPRSLRLGILSLEELRSIRLIPHSNPDRRFEIRRYSFPLDAQIQVREGSSIQGLMPTGEQTVLATSTGEVFAILERGNTVLRGMYTMGYLIQKRVKIHMYSGQIEYMTTEETEESPLGKNNPISKRFEIIILDLNHNYK